MRQRLSMPPMGPFSSLMRTTTRWTPSALRERAILNLLPTCSRSASVVLNPALLISILISSISIVLKGAGSKGWGAWTIPSNL